MKTLTLPLNDSGTARLRCYIRQEGLMNPGPLPAMLVCPGGGFNMHTPQENESAAMLFYARGFQTFVLEYPLGLGALYPATMICAARAVRLIRQNAAEWNLRPDAVSVIGFSAGAFVAAASGTFWKQPEVQAAVENCGEECRPDAMVLIYPCIGSELPVVEEGVLKTKVFRCDLLVDKDTPPAFLVSSYQDHLVCCNQALNMALSCSNHDVPFELHCYTPGEHGILANELIGTTDTGFRKQGFDTWLPDCLAWLRDLFRFPPKTRMPWETNPPTEEPDHDPRKYMPRKHEDHYPAFSLPPMPGQAGPRRFSGDTPMAEVLADPKAAEVVYSAVPWLREVKLDDSIKGMTINQCLAFADLDERPFGPPADPEGPMAKLREILG